MRTHLFLHLHGLVALRCQQESSMLVALHYLGVRDAIFGRTAAEGEHTVKDIALVL